MYTSTLSSFLHSQACVDVTSIEWLQKYWPFHFVEASSSYYFQIPELHTLLQERIVLPISTPLYKGIPSERASLMLFWNKVCWCYFGLPTWIFFWLSQSLLNSFRYLLYGTHTPDFLALLKTFILSFPLTFQILIVLWEIVVVSRSVTLLLVCCQL